MHNGQEIAAPCHFSTNLYQLCSREDPLCEGEEYAVFKFDMGDVHGEQRLHAGMKGTNLLLRQMAINQPLLSYTIDLHMQWRSPVVLTLKARNIFQSRPYFRVTH